MPCVPYFISGAKFCRPCGLGFSADTKLSEFGASTLGLIVSEAMNKVIIPQFKRISLEFEITDEDEFITLADLGALIHAQVSFERGTQIVYVLPEWLEPVGDGVKMNFSIFLATAMRAFVDEIEDASWIFPISLNKKDFIQEIENHLGFQLKFSNGWVSGDGTRKMRRILHESKMNLNKKMSDEATATLAKINEILIDSDKIDHSTLNLLDVNDGSIVSRIGSVNSIG